MKASRRRIETFVLETYCERRPLGGKLHEDGSGNGMDLKGRKEGRKKEKDFKVRLFFGCVMGERMSSALLSVCLSVSVSVCLPVCVSVCLSVRLSLLSCLLLQIKEKWKKLWILFFSSSSSSSSSHQIFFFFFFCFFSGTNKTRSKEFRETN